MPDRTKKLIDIIPPKKAHHRGRQTEIPHPEPEELPVFLAKAKPFVRIEDKPPTPLRITESLKKPNHLRLILNGVIASIFLLIAISALGFSNLKKTAALKAPQIYQTFREAKDALIELKTGEAKEKFLLIGEEIDSMKANAEHYGLFKISDLTKMVVPELENFSKAFNDITNLTKLGFQSTVLIEQIKTDGAQWFVNQRGEALTAHIENLKSNVDKITKLSADLNSVFGKNSTLTEEFLNININLQKAEHGLASLANWLQKKETKHILVLFQNPSELRPGGGFIGSYADLTMTINGLHDIKVWDIYDPDGQLDVKIIPPRELQGLTHSWGARDSNWFFDFPTSAKKFSSLLEQSKIYSEKDIRFDGVIALNVDVVKSILKTLGSVELPEYKLTITPDNFLREIQKEVEDGKDNRAGEPKRILKKLTPIIFNKLSTLDEESKKLIFEDLRRHLERKDIMIFLKDIELQSQVQALGIAGEIAELPQGTPVDYLAVAGANIASGKTDAVIAQKIKLSSKISAEGIVDNLLVIEKEHYGNAEKDLWYRKKNTSYLKIFTPRNSKLIFIQGQSERKKIPEFDFGLAGYIIDQDVKAVEETTVELEEFGVDRLEENNKTVFGAWMSVEPGKTKKMELEYLNPTRIILDGQPVQYQFIFEKQSGSRTHLDYLIEAPPGYKFRESNANAFNYVTEDPLSRETLSLTLVPDLPINQR